MGEKAWVGWLRNLKRYGRLMGRWEKVYFCMGVRDR